MDEKIPKTMVKVDFHWEVIKTFVAQKIFFPI